MLIKSYYLSFEDKESHFTKEVCNLKPNKYTDPADFLRSFSLIYKDVKVDKLDCFSFITSYPLDCIAFATARQTINAALIKSQEFDIYNSVINQFDLCGILNQPIHTISGGESVRLALAKCWIGEKYSNKMVVSSPTIFLDSDSRKLLESVCLRYINHSKEVKHLLMEGEDDESPIKFPPIVNIIFRLVLENVQVTLDKDENDTDKKEKDIARVNDLDKELSSPCLIKGKNGSGKSLLSLILSDSISHMGTSFIQVMGRAGRARLLMQDIITQTLFRTFDNIISSSKVTKVDKGTREIYQQLVMEFQNGFINSDEKVPFFSISEELGRRTLIEKKLVLLAFRIATNPSAIILDEPTWGLTKKVSESLVLSIVKVAHSKNIPVLIISHTNWFDNLAFSSINISKRHLTNYNKSIEINID